MSNVINNHFHNLYIRPNLDEYWDFFLNKDDYMGTLDSATHDYMYDKCLISYIDSGVEDCISVEDNLLSVKDYAWSDAVAIGHTMYNVGYCGLDNGLIKFRRDTNNNISFHKIFTESKWDVVDGDYRLKLHKVNGATNLYAYPSCIEDGLIKLNGGFYQGFFSTECDKYKILPTTLESGDVWHFEFMLKPQDFEKESEKTLNDKYPENKGIFFYIGTRSENKWAYYYNEDTDEKPLLGIEDYVDGGGFKKNEYKITELLNANPEFIDYEEFATDDYLNYKYFDPKLYEYTVLDGEDFLDDYALIDSTPKVINEEKNENKIITWCCKGSVKPQAKRIESVGCGCFKRIKNALQEESGLFLTKCEVFGDDYLSDLDGVDYITDFIEEDLDISNFDWETSKGMNLLSNQYMLETDNKFLLFDRTCDGFTVKNWVEGSVARYFGKNNTFKENLFLLMNRTKSGYTVYNIDELRESKEYSKEYNIYNDLFNNALCFRITDDGEIGYRYLTFDCNNLNNENYTLREAYSYKNIVKKDEWSTINVKIKCALEKMKIYMYVNGHLVFVSDEMPKIDLRKLHDTDEKQETVPFNISLGGGTQGLCDTILTNYMLDPYRTYPLEKHFGGSFIGYIKSFKFYNCIMEQCIIESNMRFERERLSLPKLFIRK